MVCSWSRVSCDHFRNLQIDQTALEAAHPKRLHVCFAIGDEDRGRAAGAFRAGSIALDKEQSLSKEQEAGRANEDLILEERGIDARKHERDAVGVIAQPADPFGRLVAVGRIEPDAAAPGFHEPAIENRPHGFGGPVLLFGGSARIQIELAESLQDMGRRLPVVRGFLPAALMLDISPIEVRHV